MPRTLRSDLGPREQVGADVLARRRDPEGLHGLTRRRGQPLRHDDLHRHEQVARALRRRHALALDAQGPTRRRALGHLDPDRPAVERRDVDLGPERSLVERDRDGHAQVGPLEREDRVRSDPHRDLEVARRSPVVARTALAAQADLLPVAHTGRDARRDRAPLDAERDRRTLRGLPERQRRDGRQVRTGTRPALLAEATTATATATATEQPAEDVLEAARLPATGLLVPHPLTL